MKKPKNNSWEEVMYNEHMAVLEEKERDSLEHLSEQGLLDGGEKLRINLEKYEHELSTLEHIRDYVLMKMKIARDKVAECKMILGKLEGKDDGKDT